MAKFANETSRGERFGYYTFFTGQNIIYMFVTIFLSMYYTSVLGLSAAAVGLILLFARVWDAVNDPMLSVIIERSRFKGGKFKPWINSITWAVPVATVVVFAFGEQIATLPMWVRITYATVSYILWGMLYTISDAPAYAMGMVMTSNTQERYTMYSFVRFGGFAGMILAMVAAPMLLTKLGGQWMLTTVIMSVVAMAMMLMIQGVKERHVVEQDVPTFKEIVGTIFGNKYLLMFIIAFVFIGGANFAFTLMPFIARDVFQDSSLTSILLFSMIGPAMLASPMVPFCLRTFGKINTFAGATFTLIALSMITWVIGYDHFSLFIILNMVKAIALGFTLILPSILIADCIEYGYIKSGKRLEAVAFASQTFANKATGAVGGAIAMAYLAMVGFIESTAGEVVVQPQRVVDGMWDVLNVGHAIGAGIGLIIFLVGYKLTDQMIAEMKAANTKDISVSEVEGSVDSALAVN